MRCHSFFGSCFLFEIAKKFRYPLSALGDPSRLPGVSTSMIPLVALSLSLPEISTDVSTHFLTVPLTKHSPPVFILGFSDVARAMWV